MAAKKPSQHLLFPEDEAPDTPSRKDPQLEQKINKYLEERSSRNASRKDLPKPGAKPAQQAEGHTGITDDEADEEGEPDYDVASRLTLKASSEAFLEVMAEAQSQVKQEDAAAAAPGKGQPKPAAAAPPKPAAAKK